VLKIEIDANKCSRYKDCFEKCVATNVCLTKAIFKLDLDDPAVVDITLCNGCALCVQKCPVEAVYLKESDLAKGSELAKEVK
jgi:Fe-S-cluster-containing hydrogenase component 2